jgi:superkiller protein 3
MRNERKDRNGPYAKFLASIKTNPSYAPAYTMLGIYYSDYARDKRRARQCFQKAFDLSGSEIEAAERLARSFADQSDWDIVEIIAQRVIDSGKARPPPGSKKKGISWPYSSLGVVQMNKQEYPEAIVSFLAALRISPDDYHSYVGLGESYHNSGRYNSALRTFMYAENPTDSVQMKKTGESWFTKYMIANVNRELGLFDEAVDGYKEVLVCKPKEFGVEIALLQTFLERAWRRIETGFFGSAVDSADEAFKVAASIIEYRPQAFNLWKAVADGCSIYSWVQERLPSFPGSKIQKLLGKSFDIEEYKIFADVDGVGKDALEILTADHPNGTTDGQLSNLKPALLAAILAEKRAIVSCSHDIHAQAVAWYNLGWMEYRAYVCLERSATHSTTKAKPTTKFLKAAMRCFKRSIELEAGNAEFWNALGVVTTSLNAKVAQHSLVRSLHLNERNVKAWANLGALYLLQGDNELAHTAFTRAQSTDPDYAHAWVGEGLIALIFGNPKEARLHFTHAFEISESSSAITKREYASRTFDAISSSPNTLSNAFNLIQPLFALQQLHALAPNDDAFNHLGALHNERTEAHVPSMQTLDALCKKLEAEFEDTESPAVLAQFAQAKADIARNQLAAHHYASATESAQTALDLTSEDEGMAAENRRKLRLSARLTLGLASYYRQDMDAALAAFKAALEESNAAPDVVCLLAEVLWAKGGEDERSVAREQLFECVERNPQHVGSIVLLGVMAAIEEDRETMDTVREELEGLRVSEGLSERDETRVEQVLEALAELGLDAHSEQDSALTEIQNAIMIAPSKPTGWTRLADLTGELYPAEMALRAALNNVPPKGVLEAEDLTNAFAGIVSIGHAQRAIMVAPWAKSGWETLLEALE